VYENMLSKLWNGLFFLGLAATAFAFLTGRDISGVPTSVRTTECSDIADHFIGDEMTFDFVLRKIQRVDRIEILARSDTSLICLGLAYFEGSPSTFVRLMATERADGQIQVEFTQALPEDYDCDLLAEEITMKFRGQANGEYGAIYAITDGEQNTARPQLHCIGMATFSSGATLPLTYAYDGAQFSFGQ
jgi:hypothetical protein